MPIADIVATLLLFTGVGLMAMLAAKWIKLPLSLWMVICGFLFSLTLPLTGWDTGVRASNFQDLMLFVLLPVLIFEAAFNLDPALLKRFLPTVSTLATLGLVLSTVITAIMLFYGIGHPEGFPFIAALLAGAVISATDPVAVVSQLKQLNAPEELSTLVEGESLFNDATAIVLFTLLVSIATGATEPNFISGVVTFLSVFFGGIVVGVVAGYLFVFLQKVIGADPVTHGVLTITLAYGGFYVAEHVFHFSGVMAVLVSAIIYRLKASLAHQDVAHGLTLHGIHHIWEFIAFIANMFVFVLLGLVISLDMFEQRWLAILIAIAAATLARLLAVYSSVFITAKLGNAINPKYPLLMWWGGLRGAVTVALVLSIPTELPYWWTIQSIGFGVVVFTLIVQANTTAWMFSKLGIKSDT